MIIAISVLNFSVKFLVTKHTQIIYFSYNVFKQPKSFLKKVSSKPKVLQMFLQIRSRRERDLFTVKERNSYSAPSGAYCKKVVATVNREWTRLQVNRWTERAFLQKRRNDGALWLIFYEIKNRNGAKSIPTWRSGWDMERGESESEVSPQKVGSAAKASGGRLQPSSRSKRDLLRKRRNDAAVWEKPGLSAGLFEWSAVHSDVG